MHDARTDPTNRTRALLALKVVIRRWQWTHAPRGMHHCRWYLLAIETG